MDQILVFKTGLGWGKMTPENVAQWISEVKAAGLARTDKDCAALIGYTPHQLVNLKREGTERRAIGLACAAALKGIKPYGK